jgi:hypothetical protein
LPPMDGLEAVYPVVKLPATKTIYLATNLNT